MNVSTHGERWINCTVAGAEHADRPAAGAIDDTSSNVTSSTRVESLPGEHMYGNPPPRVNANRHGISGRKRHVRRSIMPHVKCHVLNLAMLSSTQSSSNRKGNGDRERKKNKNCNVRATLYWGTCGDDVSPFFFAIESARGSWLNTRVRSMVLPWTRQFYLQLLKICAHM
jgi:hypothetical protein